jgi:hypothetical protein
MILILSAVLVVLSGMALAWPPAPLQLQSRPAGAAPIGLRPEKFVDGLDRSWLPD